MVMDFALPGENDARRRAVRAFLDEHPKPTGAQLGEAGLMVPQACERSDVDNTLP